MPRLTAPVILGSACLAVLTVLGTVPTARIAASAQWGAAAARALMGRAPDGQPAPAADTCTPAQTTRTPRPPDSTAHIVLARLQGDAGGMQTTALAASLRAVLAAAPGQRATLAVLPCAMAPDATPDATPAALHAGGADLVIRGRLLPGRRAAELDLTQAADHPADRLTLATGPDLAPAPSSGAALAGLVIWRLGLPMDPAVLSVILHRTADPLPAALLPPERSTVLEARGLSLAAAARQNTLPEQMQAATRAFSAAIALNQSAPAPRLQRHLGDALAWLGRHDGDPVLLQGAAGAYRRALTPALHEQAPMDWVALQAELGGVLRRMAEITGNPEPLEQAVATYRAALVMPIRTHQPLLWAETQFGLGLALHRLASGHNDPAALADAATALRAALEVYTRAAQPGDWARTSLALAAVLHLDGTRKASDATLKEAVAAYRAVLAETSADQDPAGWSQIQGDLAATLQSLAMATRSLEPTEQAVTALRAALQPGTRDSDPVGWAGIQYRLATLLRQLGEARSSPGWLTEAAATYRTALLEYSRSATPGEWAQAKAGLGKSLHQLGQMMANSAMLDQARVAYLDALDAPEAAVGPLFRAQMSMERARVDLSLYAISREPARLIAAWGGALTARQAFARLQAPQLLSAADRMLATIAVRLNK